MVGAGYRLVWLVIGCTVGGNPRITLPLLTIVSSTHHLFLLDTAKNCAYGAGLHRSMSLGFMSLTIFCFAQNHHGSYARSGKGDWY